jgi:putative alpha-1,2-mannosidase
LKVTRNRFIFNILTVCNTKKKLVLLLLLLMTGGIDLFSQTKKPFDYVNPFIGTTTSEVLTKWGSEGGTYPGAVAPSGFIQLTPETRISGTRGYNYKDSSIYYFSCLRHMSGFPSGSAGQLFIMPVSSADTNGYKRSFSHSNEQAEPGYYRVLLSDGILVEATASERAGMFRFRFPAGTPPKIWISDAGDITVNSSTTVQGSTVHSVFKFNREISSEKQQSDGSVISFRYLPAEPTVLTVQLSISRIGFENAQKNIAVELNKQDFDQIKTATKSKWTKVLSVVEINDPNELNKSIFYTALYHSLLLPWIVSDADGNYRGEDGKVHKASGKNQYAGFSPWDSYRSLHPLLALLYPDKQKDMILSMLDIYKQSGFLPIESMTGNHSIPIIVDSYLKGITGFDSLLAYNAMKKSIVDPPFLQSDMELFQSHGYIPFSHPESVTRTVEYAFDNWALANYANTVMRNKKDYQLLENRSFSYRNLFNVQDLSFLPRKEEAFNLHPGNTGYKEGDKWIYSYFVPHNGKDLVNLMGGNKAFADRLDSAFSTNLIVFDNETVLHVPYLFNEANESGKTQKWVRKFMQERYNATPGGLPGNDDLGAMSSWYVFSAMGIYPACPGNPVYAIGSPIFHSVTLHLNNGHSFKIKSNNNSDKNPYIRSLKLNNELFSSNTIPHSTVLQEGELLFEMDSQPAANRIIHNKGQGLSVTTGDAKFEMLNYSVSKKQLKPNELFWIHFKLKNTGSLGTKAVRLFINDQLYDIKNCLVPGGQTIMDSISCRLYAFGKSSLRIEFVKNSVLNVINTPSTEKEALEVTGLLVDPVIRINEKQTIRFNAKNIGGVQRLFRIPVVVDGIIIHTKSLQLKPGEATVLSQEFSVTNEGLHSISIENIRQNFKSYSLNKDALILDLEIKSKVGMIVPDNSGFKNDGQIIKTGSAPLSIDANGLLLGKDCFIEIPNSNSLDRMNSSITMMAWIFPSKEANGLVDLVTKGDNHVLQLAGNKLGFFAGGWGRGDCIVDLPSNWMNNWHHIAGVCDGKNLHVYIDGNLQGTTILEDSVNLSVLNKWNIGRNEEFPSERIFEGYLDQIKVFATPLSATEIKQVMGLK